MVTERERGLESPVIVVGEERDGGRGKGLRQTLTLILVEQEGGRERGCLLVMIEWEALLLWRALLLSRTLLLLHDQWGFQHEVRITQGWGFMEGLEAGFKEKKPRNYTYDELGFKEKNQLIDKKIFTYLPS